MNFQKRFFGWRWATWLLWLKIWSAQTFLFCNCKVTSFPTSRKCKNFNFPLYWPAEILYLQKYLTNFQKLFWLKDQERGYCGWKYEVHRHFSFAKATLQLFPHPENVKILIFPITLSQPKCFIFKIFTNFKTFFVAERWGMWLLLLKISSAQTF